MLIVVYTHKPSAREASSAATVAASLLAGSSKVHNNRATADLGAIHSIDGSLSLISCAKVDETETGRNEKLCSGE